MAANIIKTAHRTIKYWYIQLILGLLFITLGLYMFSVPVESYVVLAYAFSLYFVFSGIMNIYFSIANRKSLDGWGWILTGGILEAVLGILLLMRPDISMLTLPFYVGFWVMFRSIYAISWAIELKNYHLMDWGYLLAFGILGLLFSFILIWDPLFSGMTVVIWTALAFIVTGIFQIIFAFKLKKLKNLPDKISKNLKEKYSLLRDQLAVLSEEIQKETKTSTS